MTQHTNKAIAFLKEQDNNLALHDQDGLNYAVAGKWKEIPHEWHPKKQNILTLPSGIKFSISKELMHEINAAGLTHFSGKNKPWNLEYNHDRKTYLFYLEKTSFTEITLRLFKYEKHKNQRKHISNFKKYISRTVKKLRTMLR